jgi:hypothetical protein
MKGPDIVIFCVDIFPGRKCRHMKMASTRNRNTPGNYAAEQAAYNHACDQFLYKNQASGMAFTTHFASDGLLMGRMGSMALSENFADVESELRGIGATNLVKPRGPIEPVAKPIQSLRMIDRLPVLLPKEVRVDPNQRPQWT